MTKHDVVIIGAGGVGCAVARELSRYNLNIIRDSYHTAMWLEYYISLLFLLQCLLQDTHLHLQISAFS